MKICWDNLECLIYSSRIGKWRNKHTTYIYKDSCEYCGEAFLAQEKSTGKYCSYDCRYRHKKGVNATGYGRIVTEETRKKMSEKLAGENSPWFGKKHSEKTIEKMSMTRKQLWKTKEYQEVQAVSMNIKPNKPESFIIKTLEELFPGEYKYVGDYKFWIDGKNPDFMNINGQKKLIELFGDYWHSKRVKRKDRMVHEKERIAHFKKYGFDTLVIWEKELRDVDTLKTKIREFHGGLA